LAKEVKELQHRIRELESLLSTALQPLQEMQHATKRYMSLVGLLMQHGGLTPDVLHPDIKDPISRDIVRVLLDKQEQNISEITQRVRSKRGTSSRRIIRKKLQKLVDEGMVEKHQKGSLYVYTLSDELMQKWLSLLGLKRTD